MYKNFEDYLKDAHAKDYHGCDDYMSDAYEHWLESMDLDLVIAHADKYGVLKEIDAVKEFATTLKIQ